MVLVRNNLLRFVPQKLAIAIFLLKRHGNSQFTFNLKVLNYFNLMKLSCKNISVCFRMRLLFFLFLKIYQRLNHQGEFLRKDRICHEQVLYRLNRDMCSLDYLINSIEKSIEIRIMFLCSPENIG